MAQRTFGKPKFLMGQACGAYATSVPHGILQSQVSRPIPISYTSTTFVINASATNPVYIWCGTDLIILKETKTYTWTAAANTILNSSGVVTAAQSAATGGWYFYVGIDDSDGSYLLYPSQTAPSEHSLNHPGTSRARDYKYVGYQIGTAATTPAFLATTKIGYRLNFAALTLATATTWAELAFTGAKALPKHGSLGVTVGGHVNIGAGADSTIVVGSTSSNTTGIIKGSVSGTTSVDVFMPLPPMSPTANGKLYAQHTVAAGDVNITWIDDIV